jgi:4-amino-4-deoxy-L-arabinose transferase-like glycosyltransferase
MRSTFPRRHSAAGPDDGRSGVLHRLVGGHPALAVALLAVVVRLPVLLYERGRITASFFDKGDYFARNYLADGTYGFIPGHPSAYTQPLYGFFLVPLYWVLERHWLVVGLAQIGIAALTAALVYLIGARLGGRAVGLLAAVLTTLQPYVIWHDVHMNREILDQALAAASILLLLVLVERRDWWSATGLGAVLGLAILGNVRLALLPVLLVGLLLLWAGRTRHVALLAAAVLVVCGAVVAPWVIRNRVELGCTVVTTDGRALWKANNVNTYRVLRSGGWIDHVPPIRGTPPTPQDAGRIYRNTGRVIDTDECAQMRFYQHRAAEFVRHHPAEKAKLSALGTWMLWDPRTTETRGRPMRGGWLDFLRRYAESTWMVALYALAVAGFVLVRGRLRTLVAAIALYQTALAMVFVGETRYRIPWDFLLALLAAHALLRAWARWRA